MQMSEIKLKTEQYVVGRILKGLKGTVNKICILCPKSLKYRKSILSMAIKTQNMFSIKFKDEFLNLLLG